MFNRNQGNLAAAKAEIDRAEKEQKRVELILRDRAATMVDRFASARIMAAEYREEILPRARKAYTLALEKYGKMLASYPVVLASQRALYQLQLDYIAALASVWAAGIPLQGYLLTDGLELPARPGEVDLPVREINLPPRETPAMAPRPREP